jgi:putative addiction module CopG family antidote
MQLPADVEARVREKVARGEFSDADAVIREAMRLLDERERQLAELRGMLQTGLTQLDRGEGVPFIPELVAQMRRDAEERFRRGERASPDGAGPIRPSVMSSTIG